MTALPGSFASPKKEAALSVVLSRSHRIFSIEGLIDRYMAASDILFQLDMRFLGNSPSDRARNLQQFRRDLEVNKSRRYHGYSYRDTQSMTSHHVSKRPIYNSDHSVSMPPSSAIYSSSLKSIQLSTRHPLSTASSLLMKPGHSQLSTSSMESPRRFW